MDKSTFKSSILRILEEDVEELSPENKIKYMKKWIREYEQRKLDKPVQSTFILEQQGEVKIGLLVRNTFKKLIRENVLNSEKVRLLQDERYCKTTFDINYPFLKRVEHGLPLSVQRKINGYDRYWSDVIRINQEDYLVCNDWYERNRTKFNKWVKDIEINS
jgi:hypothetical protein